jgi:multiple antibiotic resistance protein
MLTEEKSMFHPMSVEFFNIYMKCFFLLTPFFVTSVFLSAADFLSPQERKLAALKTTAAIMGISVALFFFGKYIFQIFGISLDAFRIGAGGLLFISAIAIASGKKPAYLEGDDGDFAVVPLAVPIAIGPGTIGAILVWGAAPDGGWKAACLPALAISLSGLTVGLMLFAAATAKKFIPEKVMSVLSRLMGLIIASMAAQLIFTGIRGFLK